MYINIYNWDKIFNLFSKSFFCDSDVSKTLITWSDLKCRTMSRVQNSACQIVGTQPVEWICMVYWFHVSYFTGRQSWGSLCLHCILLKNWTLSPSTITLLCFNLHPCFAASLSHFNLILHITGFSDMTDLLRHDKSQKAHNFCQHINWNCQQNKATKS